MCFGSIIDPKTVEHVEKKYSQLRAFVFAWTGPTVSPAGEQMSLILSVVNPRASGTMIGASLYVALPRKS